MSYNFSGRVLPKSWLIIIHIFAAAAIGYAIPWSIQDSAVTNLFTIYLPALAALGVAVVAAIQTFRGDASWLLWTICSAVALLLNLINATLLFLAGIPLIPRLLLFFAFVATVLGAIMGRKKPRILNQDIARWSEDATEETWGEIK